MFAIWLSARGPLSDSRPLFGLYLYLAGRCCKNPLSARGSAQCKPGNNLFCKLNHLSYHFSITIHLHFASFYAQNTFKKIARENAIEQTTKFHLKGPGPFGRTCTLITGKLHD